MALEIITEAGSKPGTLKVTRSGCIGGCGKPAVIDNVPEDGYLRWRFGGDFIQHALPELSNAEREMLLTGTHDACWQKIFPKEEE